MRSALHMPSITQIANGLVYRFPDTRSCIPPHAHNPVSHYTYVLEGQFLIACDDGELIAGPGNFIDFPCGENHCIQPTGRGPFAVFNRFHAPCDPSQLEQLIQSDLANLGGALQ